MNSELSTLIKTVTPILLANQSLEVHLLHHMTCQQVQLNCISIIKLHLTLVYEAIFRTHYSLLYNPLQGLFILMYDTLQHPTLVYFAWIFNWQIQMDTRWNYNFWHVRMTLAEDLKGLKHFLLYKIYMEVLQS